MHCTHAPIPHSTVPTGWLTETRHDRIFCFELPNKFAFMLFWKWTLLGLDESRTSVSSWDATMYSRRKGCWISRAARGEKPCNAIQCSGHFLMEEMQIDQGPDEHRILINCQPR